MIHVKQIVNDLFTSNTYLISNEDYNYCWLIDIGDFNKIADAIPPAIDIRGVFLTHTHFDHTYGINALHKAYPDCCVYTSEYGKIALYDERKNFSKYHDASFVYEGKDVRILQDGQNVEIFPNVQVTAIATPGHCISCLTYILDNWIFTGDSYIPNIKVVTKLPNGDRNLAKQSIEKILFLAQGKKICPGHGVF